MNITFLRDRKFLIKDLSPGQCFMYNSQYYHVIRHTGGNHLLAVNMENGYTSNLPYAPHSHCWLARVDEVKIQSTGKVVRVRELSPGTLFQITTDGPVDENKMYVKVNPFDHPNPDQDIKVVAVMVKPRDCDHPWLNTRNVGDDFEVRMWAYIDSTVSIVLIIN